jgi:serine/threonine protein kinase
MDTLKMTERSPYEIKRKIGEGGMGAVYLAFDRKLNREVAIKVLRFDPALKISEEKKREIELRFHKEAQAAARLNHPNIVSIYHVGQSKGQPFIVMEFLKGKSLDKFINEDKKLPLDFVLEVMIQVCDALEFAHQSGIVHRDIKPDNIVVLEDGRVKITDFGIARIEDSDLMKTRMGTFLGSPAYSAPEQLKDFRNVDGRADIFSVGVILYQLLIGRLPFSGTSTTEIISRIISSIPPSPRALNSAIPIKLEKAIEKALAKEPANRFQRAKEMGDILREVLAELRSGKTIPDISSMKTQVIEVKRGPSPKGRIQLPAIISLIFMIAFFLFGYLYTKGERELLDKNASIRGINITKMLTVVELDLSSKNNINTINRYLQAIGTEKDILFIRIKHQGKTVAEYEDPAKVMREEDILMKSYPVKLGADAQGYLTIGFSKIKFNEKIAKVWKYTGIGLVLTGIFLAITLLKTYLKNKKSLLN